MKRKANSCSNRYRSFQYAFQGLFLLFSEEVNAIVHFIFSITAIILGVILHINLFEWLIIIVFIGLVFSLELINSSLENLANVISPEKHPLIKKCKDLAAAAVLIASITAFAGGSVIFLPKLISLLN